MIFATETDHAVHDAMNPLALFSSFSNLPSIETRKALLLLDFQNDFVRLNGRLPVRKTLDFIDLIPGLVQSFRRTGEIVWVRTQYEGPRPVVDDYGSEIIITSAGPLDTKNQKKGRHGRQDGRGDAGVNDVVDPEAFLSGPEPACQPQTAGVQFPAPILAAIDHEHDIVIVKSDYSALQSPGMVLSLRSRFVTELYICGSLSNISVYATALDAAQQGFSITLIEDCMGYRSFARHEEAVRRLADIVGANGISVQELLEEGDWEETQEIAHASSPAHPAASQSQTLAQSNMTPPSSIENVLDHLAVQNSPITKRSSVVESAATPSPNTTVLTADIIEADDNPYDDDDDEPIVLPPSKYPRASASRAMREARASGTNSARARRTKSGKSPSSSRRPGSSAADSVTLGRVSTSPVLTTTPNKAPNAVSPVSPAPKSPPLAEASYAKKKKKIAKDYLGPDDIIAEGDSRIVYNLDLPTDAFEKINKEVNWQKMYHLSGQVPRLVAVQGIISREKSFPIYRHPADESPILELFTKTVNAVRICAERIVGHPLNHALIQMYRDGQDNISEHSDKTLDIVRSSSIVNVSLGAQRVMTLRTKKSAPTDGEDGRQKQQVPMPHGSMFILGPQSNTRWLHGIRPDKRPETEKSHEEKAYNGERISLTFRNIGTFINPEQGTIWGQGAVSRRADAAQKVVHGNAVEAERLIRAFGSENRETEFDWDAVYGQGFDVVNFVEPAVAHIALSGDPVADMRVRLCLTENGMRYNVVHPPKTMDIQRIVYTSPDGHTVITGDIQILLYLASLDPRSELARPGVDVVRGGNHLIEITKLGTSWHEYLLSGSRTEFGLLSPWNERLREADQHYIAGQALTIDDLALWSILHQIDGQKGVISGSRYPHLSTYYQRIEKRGCVRVVIDEIAHERGH